MNGPSVILVLQIHYLSVNVFIFTYERSVGKSLYYIEPSVGKSKIHFGAGYF